MRFMCSAVLCILFTANAFAGETLPRPLAVNYSLISRLNDGSTAAARKAWVPKHGAGKVSMVEAGDARVLKLHCDFSNSQISRVTWDRPVKFDMTRCRALRFRIYCSDSSPIKGLTAYFKSGNGWYSAPFRVGKNGAWNTITLDKARTRIEGNPAGWSHIDAIRISIWRSTREDVDLYIADLGIVGNSSEIAIIRSESVRHSKPSELGAVMTYTEALAERLNTMDVSYSVMSDTDITAKRLSNFGLVILPYNPELSENSVSELASYLSGKGKMISFYVLPEALEPVVNIARGKHMKQKTPGTFASMRRKGKIPEGLPLNIGQASWNIFQARPVAGRSTVAANWYDDKGRDTGEPAILVSDNCIHVTHVMLTDDPAHKQTMLLAMTGHFLPDIWKKSSRTRISRIERFGPYREKGNAMDVMSEQAGDNRELRKMLEHSAKLADQALRTHEKGAYAEAFEIAGEARRLLVKCHCAMEPSEPGEFRGVWCHNAFGVTGMNWDKAVEVLAENGFTAVFPNALWAGKAYYPSKVLPVDPEVANRGDQIQQCLDACRKHGVECHVWRVCWNMGSRAPQSFMDKMRKQGRLQVSYDGKTMDQWLCPSDPRNRKLEIDSMVEVVKNYDVDGIHFDYIRYPSVNACFCPTCRRAFEKVLGQRVSRWPGDVSRGGKHRRRWLDFRRDNITAVVAAVSAAVGRIRPGTEVSAAVFNNWPADADGIGQDWKLWCEKGYLDFVCPMNYTTDSTTFEVMTKSQQELVPDTPCYPGIGFSSWPYSEDNIMTLIEQIRISRDAKAGGFMIFNYGAAEAKDILPLLGKGLTKPDSERKKNKS